MDRGTVSKRVEDLKKSIDRKSFLLCKQSIALNLFDAGLNKSLKIKSDIAYIEYFTRQDLVEEIERNKDRLAVMIRSLKISNRQLQAIALKETLKTKPRRV